MLEIAHADHSLRSTGTLHPPTASAKADTQETSKFLRSLANQIAGGSSVQPARWVNKPPDGQGTQDPAWERSTGGEQADIEPDQAFDRAETRIRTRRNAMIERLSVAVQEVSCPP